MAWGTVSTFTVGSQGATIASILNAQVKDKLDVLGTHTHSGAAGLGNDELSGLHVIQMDAVGAAGTAGMLKRNGTTLTWGASGYLITNVDPVIATPGLRTIGTGAQTASAGDHASIHNAGGSNALTIDAAVGVGSLRTLGTGEFQIAAGNHTH
jgi:hypothetical protein